jgi:hypothetical protein
MYEIDWDEINMELHSVKTRWAPKFSVTLYTTLFFQMKWSYERGILCFFINQKGNKKS